MISAAFFSVCVGLAPGLILSCMTPSITELPPRYRTLIRYARDQKITRAQAGRGVHWTAPQVRPWQSLERWLRELVLPARATSVRLYAVTHDKERLLTDFPLGESDAEQAPIPIATAAYAEQLLERLGALEQRMDALEQHLDALEQADGDEPDESEEETAPPWLAALGQTALSAILGGINLDLGGLSPQHKVGQQEGTKEGAESDGA